MFAVDRLGRLAFLAAPPSFAAHSMDTAWYAVDRQGHVAKWWSGEEGAVPYTAHDQPWEELCVELALHHALGPSEPSLASSQPPARRLVILDRKARLIGVRELLSNWDGVIAFERPEYLAMFLDEHGHCVDRVLDEATSAVAVRHVLADAFLDYWHAGAIRGACALDGHVTPYALGLYEYECGFSGPYRRARVPAHRLLLQELPPRLQHKLGALQLGLDFASTESFDPALKLPCRMYR